MLGYGIVHMNNNIDNFLTKLYSFNMRYSFYDSKSEYE